MSISHVLALPVGNALQVFLQPPASARYWRILRKASNLFSGPDDPEAIRVHEGEEKCFLDDQHVVNGVQYFYIAYYRGASSWTPSAVVPAMARATYVDSSVDAFGVVRSRLEAGLAVEVARGVLKHEAGGIPVLSAPPVYENTRWPVVTVHLDDDAPAERFLGEILDPDEFDEAGGFLQAGEGWLANVQLTIIGWTTNPDQRVTLRQAMRRVIVANLPVFDGHGMVNIQFSQKDMEDFETYAAPVYQVMCSFSCQALVQVSSSVGAIADVIVSTITK